MNEAPSSASRRGAVLAALVVILATVAIYGQSIQHEFLSWDDYDQITENPRFNPLTLDKLKRFWTEPYWRLYIPVAYTFYAAEVALATSDSGSPAGPRIDPAVFHAGSLLLHILSGLLVLLILNWLTRNAWVSCAGALLFTLHPLQVESVCWITEQRGMVSDTFALASILLFLRFATGGRQLAYVLATLSFALALLAKPSAVAVPLMIPILVLLTRRPLKSCLVPLVPWVLMSGAVIVISKLLQPDRSMDYVTPLLARPLIAGDALAFYLAKLAVPFGLGPEYGRSPRFVLDHWWGYATWIPVAVLIAFAARPLWKRKEKQSGVYIAACALFIAGVLPVLGLVPFGFQDKSTVADRYVYLAMLGPALAMSAWLNGQRRVACAWIGTLVLIVVAAAAYRQIGFWKDNVPLYAHALKVNPRSVMALNNMGTTLLIDGQTEEAADHFRRALEQDPENSEALNNLAGMMIRQRQLDEAESLSRRALASDAESVEALINLGMIHARRGKTDEAMAYQYAALRLDPGAAHAHNNLAADFMMKGDLEKSVAHFRMAVQLAPGFATARKNLGAALRNVGQFEQALEQLQAATQLAPELADAYAILGSVYRRQGVYQKALGPMQEAVRLDSQMFREINDLAWDLLTRKDLEAQRAAAKPLAEHACEVTNFGDPTCLDTLAAVRAEEGKFVEAIEVARKALDVARDAQNAQLAGQIEEHIGGYRKRRTVSSGAL